MKEAFMSVIAYLPYLLVGLAVYVVMKVKHNDEIQRIAKESYYKGQDDCLKSIPKQEEHLNKLRAEYSEAFRKDWNSHKREYRIGLVDGSKYVYEKNKLGEYAVSDGVDVLKNNRYRPAKTMHWSESDYYDEIIEEYQWETGDCDT